MTDRPITPPPEMVNEWVRMLEFLPDKQVFSEVAQWGADQELEACCEWLVRDWTDIETANKLRAARRPKPPSLKEQALTALHAVATGVNDTREQHQDLDTIRKALEALPND
jgi:hypothetical protein